jgi:hypothetical protein
MKTTVVYHRADFDGIFCREIARRFLLPAATDSSPVEFIGWDYGEPEPVIPIEETVYILDLSVPTLMGHPGLIWIDHHKSAIDRYAADIPGYRIDGVAACRLTWQFFQELTGGEEKVAREGGAHAWTIDDLPRKEDYVERRVTEPLAVRLAGEYDIWDKRDPDAETFQFALRSAELTGQIWQGLLDLSLEETLQVEQSQIMVISLMPAGRAIQRYQREQDRNAVKHRAYPMEWEGLTFLALNGKGNSLTFAARDVPESGHQALLLWHWDGLRWSVSLYHAAHRTDLDLSGIAVKHGGGGHRGACGFRCERLPWTTGPETGAPVKKNALAEAVL